MVETSIAGVLILEPQTVRDARGFFARTWDRGVLADRGLDDRISQVSIAWNEVRGTLRGLHYQAAPFEEAKTVACVAGVIWDVAVDLRSDSATFGRWEGIELSAADRRHLYIPPGCAHGYVTLSDAAEVLYMISAPHHPEASRGIRWDDPSVAIRWPEPVRRMSDRDASLPFLAPAP